MAGDRTRAGRRKRAEECEHLIVAGYRERQALVRVGHTARLTRAKRGVTEVVPLERTTSYTDAWYPQPAPVSYGHWAVVAAVWLLAIWTRDAGRGWRTDLATGTTATPYDQPWAE